VNYPFPGTEEIQSQETLAFTVRRGAVTPTNGEGHGDFWGGAGGSQIVEEVVAVKVSRPYRDYPPHVDPLSERVNRSFAYVNETGVKNKVLVTPPETVRVFIGHRGGFVDATTIQ